MTVRLITYDLNKAGQNYDGFMKVIKAYSWARLSESSYAVATTETPETVFNKLRPYMDDNDYLTVITLSLPYQAWNQKDVIDWLDANMSQRFPSN